MSTIALFIYSILQVILFTIVFTLSAVYYFRKNNPFFIALSVLFISYTLDIIVIMMTECVPSFAVLYDTMFLSVPSFKTLIMIISSACITYIYNSIFYENFSLKLYLSIALLTLVWLFCPMLPNDTYKVYIYYQAYQVFTLWIGILSYRNCVTNKEFELNKSLRFLAILLISFSVFIAIEDYIVVFNYDSYTIDTVSIQNRCFTEDILRFILSFSAIKYLLSKINPKLKLKMEFDLEPHELNHPIHHVIQETNDNNESEDEKFTKFCSDYDLTTREQEIFKLILAYKSVPEISEALYIAAGTTKTHMHKIYQKIGVTKRNQLITIYNEYEEK